VRRNALLLVILIALAAIAVIDLVFFPEEHLALLYVIPLGIAAIRAPPWVVMLTAMAVFVLDFVSFYFQNAPLGVWLLTFIALVAVCFIAFWRSS